MSRQQTISGQPGGLLLHPVTSSCRVWLAGLYTQGLTFRSSSRGILLIISAEETRTSVKEEGGMSEKEGECSCWAGMEVFSVRISILLIIIGVGINDYFSAPVGFSIIMAQFYKEK